VKLRWGSYALAFGMAAVLVALAGLLYVAHTITAAALTVLEIGAVAHG
jgi:hypothetical protein